MSCVQQTVEEKIEAKKKELFGVNPDLLTHSRDFLHLPSTISEEQLGNSESHPRKVSISSSDSAAFKSASAVSAGSCESEDFVIHRRPSMKSVRSLKSELARLDDRASSSSYEPADFFRVSDWNFVGVYSTKQEPVHVSCFLFVKQLRLSAESLKSCS